MALLFIYQYLYMFLFGKSQNIYAKDELSTCTLCISKVLNSMQYLIHLIICKYLLEIVMCLCLTLM